MPWVMVDFEGTQHRVPVVKTSKGVWVGWPGGSVFVEREHEFASAKGSKEDCVIAPMTGRVLEVRASVGDAVVQDQVLVILEAMKMENSLKAERDAIISKVHVIEGQVLDQDAPIIEFQQKIE